MSWYKAYCSLASGVKIKSDWNHTCTPPIGLHGVPGTFTFSILSSLIRNTKWTFFVSRFSGFCKTVQSDFTDDISKLTAGHVFTGHGSSRQKLNIWTVSVQVFELESIQISTSLVLPRHVSRSTQLTSLTSSPPYYLTKSTHHEAPFFNFLQGFSHQLSLSAKYSPQRHVLRHSLSALPPKIYG